jgi:ornithine lipid hydroxylase
MATGGAIAPAPSSVVFAVRRPFSYAVFPVTVAVTIGGSMWSMSRGVEPVAAVAPWIVGAYLFVALAERVFPYRREWLHSKGDLRVDGLLFAANAAANALFEPVLLLAGTWVAAWFSNRFGAGLWPANWPLLAQLALALIVAELWEYSWHRAMHERACLWRLHALHHSAPRLYWLNAIRFHPLDLMLAGQGKLLPVAALGAGAPALALLTLFSAVHGTFQHANLEMRLGPLNWIFSMAELHRWHHSPDLAVANHNYGGNLILWDVVFGTRFLPVDREPPAAIGIGGMPRFPSGFLALLASPFRWRRVVAESS